MGVKWKKGVRKSAGYYGHSEEASSSTSGPEPWATLIPIFGSSSSTYPGQGTESEEGATRSSGGAPATPAPITGYPPHLFLRCSQGVLTSQHEAHRVKNHLLKKKQRIAGQLKG